MKKLSQKVFGQIRKCLYRHGRYVEVTWWRYLFEHGSQEEAIAALAMYQNDDGGFGHGLEPDCANPASSPATTYSLYTPSVLGMRWEGTAHDAGDHALCGAVAVFY